MFGKVLAVIVSDGDYSTALGCLKNQTVQPDKVIVADKPFPDYKFAGERVGLAMRDALSRVDLEDFSYIFRLDDDVIVPADYLEHCLALDFDLVGRGGYAMLLKTASFLEVFKEYPVDPCEDSMICHSLLNLGYRIADSPVKPIFVNPKRYSWYLFFVMGVFRRRVRYHLVSLLLSFRDKTGGNLVGWRVVYVWLGYLYAFVHGLSPYWFVKYRHSTNRLVDSIISKLKS